MIEQAFKEWRQGLRKMHLAAWDELPEMNLYVDQVVSYVNDHFAGGTVNEVDG